MPRLIPTHPQFESVADVYRFERDTLAHLDAGLNDDLTVYHGVHWSTATRQVTRYGEINFVIVHADGRVLVIEQKNGLLEETDAGLFKSYSGRRKQVGDQLHRSIDAIRQKFAAQHPREPGLSINYLLYCPDYHVTRDRRRASPSILALQPSTRPVSGAHSSIRWRRWRFPRRCDSMCLWWTKARIYSRGSTDRVLSCGMSRATVRLEILISDASPLTESLMAACSAATEGDLPPITAQSAWRRPFHHRLWRRGLSPVGARRTNRPVSGTRGRERRQKPEHIMSVRESGPHRQSYGSALFRQESSIGQARRRGRLTYAAAAVIQAAQHLDDIGDPSRDANHHLVWLGRLCGRACRPSDFSRPAYKWRFAHRSGHTPLPLEAQLAHRAAEWQAPHLRQTADEIRLVDTASIQAAPPDNQTIARILAEADRQFLAWAGFKY